MKVKLMHYTPLAVCSTAIRTCWDSHDKSDTVKIKYCAECGIRDINEWNICNYCDSDKIESIFLAGKKDKELIDRVGNKFKHACYDDQTETLTSNGWKKISEISFDDYVCTLNPNSKTVEMQKPTNLFKFPFNGELIHFKSRHMDLMVTPNHKIYVASGDKKVNRDYSSRVFTLEEAKNYLTRRHYHTKRSNGVNTTSMLGNSFLKLVGFFIGDGYYTGGNTISFRITKQRKIKYLKRVAKELNFGYKVGKHNNHIISIPKDKIHFFREIYTNKKVPSLNFIFSLSKDNLIGLLDGWINADGDYKLYKKGVYEITTTNKKSVDIISIITTLIGWDSSLTNVSVAKKDIIWSNGSITKKENIQDCYEVRVITKKLDARFNNSKKENRASLVKYTGDVYCLEVPNHIIMVRRNGKKVWSGNSTLEHLVYTFYIKGISRACLQELARHRIASLSVKSTRYTLKELRIEDVFDYSKIPVNASDFYKNEVVKRASKYLVYTGNIEVDYISIVGLYNVQRVLKMGYSNDIVKYALPEAYKTELTWTINLRSLQNFLRLRTDKSALWEIRDLANLVYKKLPEDHKYLFEDCLKDKKTTELKVAEMQKECKHCLKTFTVSPKHRRYCSDKCKREYYVWKRREWKRNETPEQKEHNRKKQQQRKAVVKRLLDKNAVNKGNPFTSEEVQMIMARKQGKFIHTPTNLAYAMGRTKRSIERKRKKEMDKLNKKKLNQ